MARAKCYPVVLLLVPFLAPTLAAHVEPPSNVTLHCRNLHNIVEWSYKETSPGVRFRIDFGSVAKFDINTAALWVEPPNLQADVSFLSDPSDEYYLTVTAVNGQNESAAIPEDGIVFSYFIDSLAEQKCFVDLPSVNVTAIPDDFVQFSFTHPWLLYQQKLPGGPNPQPRTKKSNDFKSSKQKLPVFMYDVVIINQTKSHHHFSCHKSVCTEKLPVDPSQDTHCLKIWGELKKMSVKATQGYCALPADTTPHAPNNYTFIYITVAILLALAAAAFVLFLVFYKKISPSTSLPDSMDFTRQFKQWTFGVVREPVLVAEVDPTTPTPLLSATEEEKYPPTVSSTTEPDLRLPLRRVSAEDEGVCDIMANNQNEGPGYTQGKDLEKDETLDFSEAPSGYEKRDQVVVELAPDEQAEGYRG